MKLALQVNAFVLLSLGLFMLADAGLYPATRDVFLEGGLGMLTLGAMLMLTGAGRRGDPQARDVFLATTTVWVTAAAAGAVPLMLWQMTLTDAFFEAMSGITTTGSTVIVGLDGLPHGILLWRAILQWLGGIGFIVTAIAALPFLRVGGMQLFRSESSEREAGDLGGAARRAVGTFAIYIGLTALCFVAYNVSGMSDFDALTHAMTSLSTGGYSTHDASMGFFPPAVQWWGALFMLAGSLPFAWYARALIRREPFSEQVGAYLPLLAVVIAALTVYHFVTGAVPFGQALREVAFSVVSVVTTTGYANSDYLTWGSFAVTWFVILTCAGGCTGSTSGGIKMMRWIVLARALRLALRRVSYPSSVAEPRYEGRPLERSVIDAVMAFVGIFFATTAVLAVALGSLGLDFETSLTGALTALANVGPGAGATIGPAGSFAPLPDAAKWILSLGMLLGRLEIMTALVLLLPSFWRW